MKTPISKDAAFTAQMFLELHGNMADGFYRDICKMSRALLEAYWDQEEA